MKKFVSYLPFLLLFVAAMVMGVATFVEDLHGSYYISQMVYGATWFRVLWGLLVAASLWEMWRRRLWHRMAVLLLHASLMLILAGGLTTALTSQTGMISLRQGQPNATFIDEDEHSYTLPFLLRLDTFYIKTYAGTDSPQDYVSELTLLHEGGQAPVQEVISMNCILEQDGYRLYQSSYDDDGLGSILTVTYDPWGTPMAYLGFLLFGVASLLVLFSRRGGFRASVQGLGQASGDSSSQPSLGLTALAAGIGALFVVGLSLLPWHRWLSSADSGGDAIPCMSRAEADSLSAAPVVWNGRICPFNTLATEFTLKLSGQRRPYGYTPEQVVGSWALYPKPWSHAPLIKVRSRELRERLGMEGKYISFAGLYNGDEYRLRPLFNAEEDKQSKLSKAILEVDEGVGLIKMLQEETLVQLAPADAPSLSPLRVRAEIFYNRYPFVSILFMANLTLGLLALLFYLFRGKSPSVFSMPAHVLLWMLTLLLFFVYLLRWYVSGRVPLSNGFETMMFAALCVQVLGCVLSRRFAFALSFAFLLPGFVLLVAHLGIQNPQISSLMPVLNSPWLSSHVSTIMISYALLTFTFVIAVLALLRRSASASLTLLSRSLLFPAVMFLGVGIFLGSVWANVSWGTYWAWDPKEVWALITMMVYSVPLHPRLLPWFQRERTFHIYMIFAFLCVLMTYFGVNYVLGGMHSYAG